MFATICAGGIVIKRHVFVRVNAAGAEPIARPHGVSAGREGHREGHRRARLLGLIDQRLQRLGSLGSFGQQLFVERDCLAVAIEHKGDNHRLLAASRAVPWSMRRAYRKAYASPGFLPA